MFKKRKQENKEIVITDLGLIATLNILKVPYKKLFRVGKYINCVYEKTENLQNIMNKFYTNDLLLPPKVVIEEYKTLKKVKYNYEKDIDK